MASEKKPSIYSDRGTIGSSDELDEYGVWVKTEPQDLSSVGAENQESMDVPDINDLPDFSLSAEASSDELAEDNISLDEDLELPDINFEDDSSGEDEGFEEAAGSEDDEIIDFGESSTDLDESGGSDEPAAADNTESFEFSELPEPDFSDFVESGENPGEEQEDGEISAGDEAENLGFVEVSMDAGDDVVVEDIPDQPLAGSGGGNAASSPKEAHSSSPDLSTQLLMRIADELASIRTELSTLKSELAGIKTETASAETDEAQNRGFFDEEDDEKIALTGDELDNILNTADFTEEAGADATEGLDDDLDIKEVEDNASGSFQEITETPSEGEEADDISLDDITKDLDLSLEEKDLDELGGELNFDQIDQAAGADESQDFEDTPSEEPPEEPIEFDITMNEDGEDFSASFEEPPSEKLRDEDEDIQAVSGDLSDLEDKDSEDLRRLREEGAEPMTPAPEPEDTSFLEEDPLAFSEFDEESIDLSDAVIEEPDLSGEIQENPLEEPSLDDISIDLDLDEEISLDEDKEAGIDESGEIESPEEEIELPVSEGSDESFEVSEEELEDSAADLALIPEGFVVEADDSQSPAIDEGEEVFSETREPDAAESDDTLLDEEKGEVLPLAREEGESIPSHLKQELKTVLSYMDQLLESLPDEKIEEFAKSEYFDTYKKLFKELGLV
jgi:hypothetical protein